MRRIGSFTATTGIANIFSLTTRSLAASTFVWAIVWLQCIEDASSSMATTTTPVIPTTPWVQGVGRKDLQLHHRLQQNRQTKEKSPRITTQQQQTEVRAYELWQPEEIVESILRWAGHYPDLLRVTTSQSAYDLPSAGGKNDCPFEPDNEDGCRNYILTLQDFAAHPEGSESSARLPELLWSGELHGNERVGPTAVLEATLLLLEAASCEELPRLEVKQQKADLWKNELERANSCREKLARQGIDDEHRQWLARLVTTRRIVIVPTANALGYFQNTREENGIDPNRDFPYDVLNPKDCMQTIAGRTLNEVFREHLFQLSLTFHGGMEMIGYEWGATSWQDPNTEKTPVSPDNTAQTAIAMAYSDFAGGWSNTENYGFGPMNDAVYPVRGGMEDWAYAASWDTKRVIQCEPDTYDSYPVSKTTYDSSTLRVFNMLVETSNDKTPNKSSLGTTLDLMSSSSNGNGHVARNIRLALLAAELVEPYVRWRTVNALRVSDDLVPMTSRSGSKVCQLTKAMAVPDSSETVRVEWTVGGALSISSTLVYFAKWDAGLEALLDCQQQPDTDMLLPMMKKAVSISETSGTTKFSHYGSSPSTFSAEIDISHFQTGDTIAVIALAQVDQNWGETLTENLAPELKPQSHMANVRTDPTWYHAKPDKSKIIQGRLNWVSVPLTLVLERFDAQSAVHAKELWHRYDESWVKKSSHSGTSGASEAVDWTLVIVGVAVVLAVSLLIGQIYLRYEMRQSRRERVREFIEDEGAVSPGLQQIATLEEKNGGSTIKNGYSDATMENNNNELELANESGYGSVSIQ